MEIKARPLARGDITKLRAVVATGLDPKEGLEKQKVALDEVFGTLTSALATYEYMKLQAEYKRRGGARGSAATQQRWQAIVGEMQTFFAAAGVRGVDEPTLNTFVKELTANGKNRDYITDVANSAQDAGATRALSASSPMLASLVPYTAVVIDPDVVLTPIRDLCTKPIAEGTYTKHFSRSITLSVKIPYPCCSWTGCRWCYKTVSLGGVSVSLNVNVGYKVTCCGATAWGQGYAEVCGTILGKKVCAGCSATVVGVTGVGRTPVGSGCEYGLGVEARLKCTLAGQTIVNVTYSFGWVVSGPCPPAGLCP